MNLRKGKTKELLDSSIDAALLAVEIYNKPRAPFRTQNFIVLMIVAWTRLFHAYFQSTIGEKYFYKKKNGRYEKVDGERKAWELSKCIKEYGKLSRSIQANLQIFILLRNKIEHRSIDQSQIGISLFGECQSLLYNYESLLIHIFGEGYALNENLAYSLQFSTYRDKKQMESTRRLLSKEVKDISNFIESYRSNLADDIYNSQEYSIKLIQIPKISNTSRNDLAIEFVKFNELSDDDKKVYNKISALIKDRVVRQEAINPGKLKPGKVIEKVNKQLHASKKINRADHKCLLAIFGIRPYESFIPDKDLYETNVKYCHYDETHNDYVYQESWVAFLVKIISNESITKDKWHECFSNKSVLDISNYE